MKTKSIALACAAVLAGPALAQSSVTIYGNLDVGMLSISNVSTSPLGYLPSPAGGGRATLLKDGGIGASNWGIRGVEDLGGGMKATFQLQGNVAVDTGLLGGPNSSGTTSTFNQFATLGLSGAWGEVKFGRQVSPMYYAMAATDPRGARYFGSVLTGLVGLNSASGAWVGNNSNVAFGTIYNDNAIVYNSPSWNGLTASVEYALGETTGSTKANSQQAASLIWRHASGLVLSGLYYNGYGNNFSTATALYTAALGAAAAPAAVAAAGFSPTANTNRLTGAGALYTWGAWTVGAQLLQARNPAHAIVKGGSDRLDLWDIGFGWKPAQNVNVTVGYYRIKDKRNVGNKATQFAAGVEYSLSRRTTLYAQAATVSNKGANMNLGPVYATPAAANKGVNAVMVGVRHSF